MKKGIFISIEGVEGVGKSTLLNGLQLPGKLPSYTHFTREPGGCPVSESIRSLLVTSHKQPLQPFSELLLIYAARNEHLHHVIRPALSAGHMVISDRFFDASYAYQSVGRDLGDSALQWLDRFTVQTTIPDLTILMYAPITLCLQRILARGNPDRFDSEDASFFQRVQEKYLSRAKMDPNRFLLLDGTLPKAVLLEKAIARINALGYST